MSGRIEEYRSSNGTWHTDRSYALMVHDLHVLVQDRLAKANSWLPLNYFMATAEHESGLAANERDTEVPDQHGVRFQSWGVFQISEEEAQHFGFHAEDMLDPANAVLVMVGLAGRNESAIVRSTPPWAFRRDDLGAYLSIAHNQGLGAALETIHLHGMDWSAYKDRNLRQAEANVAAGKPGAAAKLQWWHKVFKYGDDCNGS